MKLLEQRGGERERESRERRALSPTRFFISKKYVNDNFIAEKWTG